MLQAALRNILGSHVEQAGSYVNEKICRFDFTHFAALTSEEIAKIEALVNINILVANSIQTIETDIETARANGAMALFGEKYGDVVRMVKMGDFSTELCGGTHCDNTGKIGLFKIISESSVAAGVRRIEAVTGTGVLELIAEKDNLINDTARELKVANSNEIAKRATALQSELSAAKKEIDRLNAKIASGMTDNLFAGAVEIKGVKLVSARLDNVTVDVARNMTDKIKSEHSDAVVVLAITNDGKLNFVTAAGKDAVASGVHAGKLAGQVAAITGGKGGGRPDNAMAGGADVTKIDAALATANTVLEGMIK